MVQSHLYPTGISPGTMTLPANPKVWGWGYHQLVSNFHNHKSDPVTLLNILRWLPSCCPWEEDPR